MYALQDIDDSAYPYYYGFVNKDGGWYIMRQDKNGSIRYAMQKIAPKGQYTKAWNNRTNLIYTYWDTEF